MTRRITIPEDHVAVILPNQLADELQSLLNIIRRSGKAFRFGEEGSITKAIASDVLLRVIDAREA